MLGKQLNARTHASEGGESVGETFGFWFGFVQFLVRLLVSPGQSVRSAVGEQKHCVLLKDGPTRANPGLGACRDV